MVQDTRTLNRNAVLTELLRSRPVSRKQISVVTGISAATVTRTVDALISEGILAEGSELIVENRGRRAVLLDLVADRAYVLGIDMGASNTRFIVSDLLGNPLVAREIATPTGLGPADLAAWLVGEVKVASAEYWPTISEISLGLPGAVSQHARTVSNAPNLPQVEDPAFLAALDNAIDRGVYLDNDANFALLGEQRFGAAQGTPSAAMLTLGTGLGAALSVDGRILRGRHGLVGEFGQLPVGPLGTRLEHMVTGSGIVRRAAEAGIHLDTPADLFVSSASNAIQGLRAHFDQALLIVLTAIAVSCEPETIVLGGGISKSLIDSLPKYQDALQQNLRISPKLISATLGDFSGAVGAVVASLHAAYSAVGVEDAALSGLPNEPTLNLSSIRAVQPGGAFLPLA